jgi:hypothetical protein
MLPALEAKLGRFNALLKVFPLLFGRVHGRRQQMA